MKNLLKSVLLFSIFLESCGQNSENRTTEEDYNDRAVKLVTSSGYNIDSVNYAILLLDSAIFINKAYSTAYFNKANFQSYLNDRKSAALTLSNLLQQNENCIDCYLMQGHYLSKDKNENALDKYNSALKICQKQLKNAPNNVNILLKEAFCYLFIDRMVADQKYKNIENSYPNNLEVKKMKGFIKIFNKEDFINSI